MKKFITQVTVTGADDSTDFSRLFEIQKKYPYVEFGILLSDKYLAKEGVARLNGVSRFPSSDWLWRLISCNQVMDTKLRLSGHICGKWVKQALRDGTFPDLDDRIGNTEGVTHFFSRWQLNTHAEYHTVNFDKLEQLVKDRNWQSVIFQLDNVNEILPEMLKRKLTNVSGLFDLSHGAGILPSSWPEARKDVYLGYAGGLSPDNVVEQCEKIAEVVGDEKVWIDAETHLRSPDNRTFDLDKVEEFLEKARPFVYECGN